MASRVYRVQDKESGLMLCLKAYHLPSLGSGMLTSLRREIDIHRNIGERAYSRRPSAVRNCYRRPSAERVRWFWSLRPSALISFVKIL